MATTTKTRARSRKVSSARKARTGEAWTGPTVPMATGELIPIDGFGSKTVLLDPPTAQVWLDSQVRNRGVKKNNVDFLSRQIEEGRFVFNGEPAIFDADGHMINGQHRCLAVLETGKTVPILVVWGLPPESQDTMDQGTVRGFDGALSMDGVQYARRVASAARLIYNFEQTGVVNGNGIGRVSIPELREVVERHPNISEAGRVSRQLAGNIRYPGAVSGALYTLFSEVSEEDAEAFFDRLRSGADLPEDDPIFALRRVVINEMGKQYHIDNYILSALTIKAWNKWRRGEKVQNLRFRRGGANPEQYPDIDGYDYDTLTRP